MLIKLNENEGKKLAATSDRLGAEELLYRPVQKRQAVSSGARGGGAQ